MVVTAGCAGEGKWSIRPVPTGFAEGERPASFRVAEARSHFALGSIALAAEGFRRALREDPSSVDAMNGLAACFDRMGRFDLARTHYERALANAPNDPRLYANLATSLDLQGKGAEAAAVRREAAVRFAAALPLAAPTAVATLEPAVSPAPAVTVPLAAIEQVQPPPDSSTFSRETVAERTGTVSRLERTNLAEVTLRTGGKATWIPLRQARAPIGSAVTSAPAARASRVVVLNGTSQVGLAARTRIRLHALGWHQVVIGNTAEPLRGSQILYPPARAAEARLLARRLGLPLRQRDWAGDRLVVHLGRERSRRPGPA
jgi:tetratricopeptide (TPR) repeat protein